MLKPIISVYLNIYFWINYLNSNLRSNELGIVWVFFYIIESPCFRIWLDFFINSDLVQRIKSSTYVHMNDDGRTQTEANGVKWLSNTKKKNLKKRGKCWQPALTTWNDYTHVCVIKNSIGSASYLLNIFKSARIHVYKCLKFINLCFS